MDKAKLNIDVLFRTQERFSSWIQFADAKAGAVLALLALGFADLLENAGRLSTSLGDPSLIGRIAGACFWLAAVSSGVTVVLVSRALFPQLKAEQESLFYFAHVARRESPAALARDLQALDSLEDHLVSQVWRLAQVATTKFERTRLAYFGALGFLFFWAASRLALSLTNG